MRTVGTPAVGCFVSGIMGRSLTIVRNTRNTMVREWSEPYHNFGTSVSPRAVYSRRATTIMNPAADRDDAALKKRMKKKSKSQGSAKSCGAGLSARLLNYATDATVHDILDAEYWRALVPFLHVGKMDRQSLETKRASSKRLNAAITPVGKEIFRQQRQKLTEDGYCLAERCENGDERSENLDQVLIDKLAFAASVLEHYGWPTTFLAIYDEAWELAQQCQDWMDRITKAKVQGGEQVRNLFCMDIVGFNVVDGIGFSAHRDRQPEDWQPKGHASEDPKTTFDNGFARYITCWVALSDAHPGNSCLHYVTGLKIAPP